MSHYQEKSLLLYLKTKKNLKKDASHIKIAGHSNRQKKNIEKREKKKRKMRKSQTILSSSFFTWQVIENIVISIVIAMDWSCRRSILTQNTWQ